MNLMLSRMRQNQEVLVKLKQLSPDGKLPKGALLEAHHQTIEFASRQYEIIKGLDSENEKWPRSSEGTNTEPNTETYTQV